MPTIQIVSIVGCALLLVIASGLYRLLAKHMRGYADAQSRYIFRDLIDREYVWLAPVGQRP